MNGSSVVVCDSETNNCNYCGYVSEAEYGMWSIVSCPPYEDTRGNQVKVTVPELGGANDTRIAICDVEIFGEV